MLPFGQLGFGVLRQSRSFRAAKTFGAKAVTELFGGV